MNSLLSTLSFASTSDAIPDDRVVSYVFLIDHVREQLAVDTLVHDAPEALVIRIVEPVSRRVALASPLPVFLFAVNAKRSWRTRSR